MRVLIIHPKFYVYGGAELVIVKLANYLTKKGIQNAILTTSILSEIEKDLRDTEIIIQKEPKIPFLSSGFEVVFALWKGIRNNLKNFDLINIHNYPAEFSIFPFQKSAVWLCNEPPGFVLRSESELSLFLKLAKGTILKIDRFIVKHLIKKVIVSDEFNAKRFERLYSLKPDIINYGIDYNFFSQGNSEQARKEYNLNDNFVVLQVGILTSLKNQMKSIETVEKLKDKIPGVKLVLAGLAEKEYKLKLEKYVQEKKIEKYVIFTGQLNREKVKNLYHACDVLLHPIKPQGGWLSPFEALCAKKPIVVSPEMSASDIIKKEKIGVVTNDYEVAITEIYGDKNKYLEMGKKGSEWVRNNLSWDVFCQKNLDLFQKVLRP